jgi:hypothetical protein
VSSSTPVTARRSALGVTALIVAIIAVLVSALVIPLGYLPGMGAAWALMFFTIPITVIMALVALAMAIVALVLDIRARRRITVAVIALVLSAVTVLTPVVWFAASRIVASSVSYEY